MKVHMVTYTVQLLCNFEGNIISVVRACIPVKKPFAGCTVTADENITGQMVYERLPRETIITRRSLLQTPVSNVASDSDGDEVAQEEGKKIVGGS